MIENFEKLEDQFYDFMESAGPYLLKNFYRIKRASRKGFKSEPDKFDRYTFSTESGPKLTYEITNYLPQQKIEVVVRRPFGPPLSFTFIYVFTMFKDSSPNKNHYLNYYQELKTFFNEFSTKIP